MIDNWEAVRKAHDTDDLCFGTVESWIAFVCPRLIPDADLPIFIFTCIDSV